MTSTIRRPAQVLAVLLVAVLALMMLEVTPAEAANRTQQKIEKRLHNQERKIHGRRHMRLHRRLNRVARLHSLRMARKDRLYHNPRLARQLRRLRWRRLGENVGYTTAGSTVPSSLNILHDAFMKSRPHRRNVLNRRFKRMGVGMARGSGGKLWITVVFMG